MAFSQFFKIGFWLHVVILIACRSMLTPFARTLQCNDFLKSVVFVQLITVVFFN